MGRYDPVLSLTYDCLGVVGLGDPVPGDLHGHLHALRGRLPPQRAGLQRQIRPGRPHCSH